MEFRETLIMVAENLKMSTGKYTSQGLHVWCMCDGHDGFMCS